MGSVGRWLGRVRIQGTGPHHCCHYSARVLRISTGQTMCEHWYGFTFNPVVPVVAMIA